MRTAFFRLQFRKAMRSARFWRKMGVPAQAQGYRLEALRMLDFYRDAKAHGM